jgi:asparagine synthase (glutamine-hydrolysing)
MCGIAGIVGPTERVLVSRERVARMVRSMQHRGPDDDGVFAAPMAPANGPWQGVLGACRLAIQDLTLAGHQPMVDPASGSVIVFNGEIYNFHQLRDTLLREGVALRSSSDTEVVLHLFLRQGRSMLRLLEGMYALAIWSPRSGELFLARDRLGVKPLYFTEQAGCVAFASEIRALLAGDCAPRRLSPEGIESFLRFGAPREPHTIIEGVEELGAGSWLIKSPKLSAQEQFWSADSDRTAAASTRVKSFGEAASEVRDLLLEGVRARLVSDVPVVTFLSGGLDSSCIVAAVREMTGQSPATIGITFSERTYSESESMWAVADHLGCRHVNHELSEAALLELIPRAVGSMDQPTIDGINTFIVSKVAAESGFKVALSGVGGDELFGGYPSFRAVPLLATSKRLFVGRLGRDFAATLAYALPAGERRKKVRRWFGKPRMDEGDVYDLIRELFHASERRSLLGRGRAGGSLEPVVEGGRLSFSDISRRELTQYMRNVLLRDTDCFGMACSLELREPYLHVPLVEFLLALPDAWKARRPPKALLREAFADVLPESTVRRPKRGFVLPFHLWLRTGPLRDSVEEMLEAPDDDLLDRAAVSSVWQDFQAGGTSWNRVWALYVLRQWCARHIAN